MCARVIVFLEIFLVIVLIISPQVAVARELALTSNTFTAKAINRPTIGYGAINPKKPIPGRNPGRKCDYRNRCYKSPPQPKH